MDTRKWAIDIIPVLVLLGGCAVGGCRAADLPDRSGSGRDATGSGAFQPWSAYPSAPFLRLAADARRRWIAVADAGGRLRVWSMRPDGRLAELLLDSVADSFTVRRFAWCGDLLLYNGWEGQVDLHRLDVFPPPEGTAQYLADRALHAGWDPVTRARTAGAPSAFREALADSDAKRLVVFDDLPEEEFRRRGGSNLARILRVRGFEPLREFQLDLGAEVGNTAWLLGWSPAEDGFYAVGRCLAPFSPSDPQQYDFPLLAFVDADGHVTTLSGDRDPRLAHTCRSGVPAISLVQNGMAVAGLVEHWQGGTGIGVYDLSGLRHEYRFGLRASFPPDLMEISPWWRFIACTRDAKQALFQETRDPRDQEDERTGPWWVCLWDLEQQAYEPIVRMNEIKYCFDWLSDTALIVGARAETIPPGAKTTELYDYGVLHLTKPDE